MSRSVRVPATFVCCGADPKKGKAVASRGIRHAVRRLLHAKGEDFDFVHAQDRTRGDAGSRSRDYGWDYFGDGRYVVKRASWRWRTKLSRK